jgi:hypothetical protein
VFFDMVCLHVCLSGNAVHLAEWRIFCTVRLQRQAHQLQARVSITICQNDPACRLRAYPT